MCQQRLERLLSNTQHLCPWFSRPVSLLVPLTADSFTPACCDACTGATAHTAFTIDQAIVTHPTPHTQTPNLAACECSTLLPSPPAHSSNQGASPTKPNMPNNDNPNQRRNIASGASIFMGAVGVIAGLAAAEHIQAREQNRESVVEGMGRWLRQTVTDLSGSSGRGQVSGTMPSPLPRALTRGEVNLLPVRRIPDADTAPSFQNGAPTFHAHPAPIPGTETLAARGQPLPAAAPADPDNLKTEKPFCVICRESYAPGDTLLRLPCFHEFHGECIRDYLETAHGPLCPICRHPVIVSSQT